MPKPLLSGQADRLGEVPIAVCQHGHRPGIVLRLPGAHHEDVVDRGAGDLVHALGLELVGLVDIAGQMAGGAGGGVATGTLNSATLRPAKKSAD